MTGMITKHKVVQIAYVLKVDGEVADSTAEGQPLDYIHGCHMLIPGIEDALEGHVSGDKLHVTIPPEDAYGAYDPGSRFNIPKTSFEMDGKLREDLLEVGRTIPMLNGEGAVCHARIMEIGDQYVNVDFNHPMAGKTLQFDIEVLSVRDATRKELDEGLHGEFLPQEGGCCHGGGRCHKGRHSGEGECCHGGECTDGDDHHCCHGDEGHHHD